MKLIRQMTAPRAKQSGFTLLEVMVALVIVSFGVITVVDATGKHVEIAGGLEKRMVASWVASNKVAELRHKALTDRVRTGNKTNIVKMGGLRWRTQARIQETEVERVFLLTVDVREQSDRNKAPYASVTTAITDRL